MSSLLRNVRYSAPTLWKNPSLTLKALFTLTLGIGANAAIFTVDYATLLAPMPCPEPDQLVVVWSKIQTFHNGISAGDFTDWKRKNSSFQDINAFTGGSFNIASKDQPENIDGSQVTAGFYKMLGHPSCSAATSCPKKVSRARTTSSSSPTNSGHTSAVMAKSSANPCASTVSPTLWSASCPLAPPIEATPSSPCPASSNPSRPITTSTGSSPSLASNPASPFSRPEPTWTQSPPTSPRQIPKAIRAGVSSSSR